MRLSPAGLAGAIPSGHTRVVWERAPAARSELVRPYARGAGRCFETPIGNLERRREAERDAHENDLDAELDGDGGDDHKHRAVVCLPTPIPRQFLFEGDRRRDNLEVRLTIGIHHHLQIVLEPVHSRRHIPSARHASRQESLRM